MKVDEGQSHPSWDSSTSQGSPGRANLRFGLPCHDEDTGNNMKIENSMDFSINENSQVFYNPRKVQVTSALTGCWCGKSISLVLLLGSIQREDLGEGATEGL